MTGRVNELDFLRVAAIGAVLFYHYTFRGYAGDNMSVVPFPEFVPVTKYGYLGVHLFFMISGFVILMTASSGDLCKFIASRCARLYPAMWACCTMTYVAVATIGGGHFIATFQQYLVNLTLMNAFFGVAPIDGAYWSLIPEIEFYGAVATIVTAGQIARMEAVLLAAVFGLGLVIATSVPTTNIAYLIDDLPYFAAGAFYYLIWAKGHSAARWLGVAASWVLAGRECMSFLPLVSAYYRIHMSAAVVATIVTSYFVVFAAIATRSTGRFGAIRWVSAGAITYPLYLVHQNLGFMLFNALYPAADRFVLLAGITAAMVALAWVIHETVERPLGPLLRRTVERMLALGRPSPIGF